MSMYGVQPRLLPPTPRMPSAATTDKLPPLGSLAPFDKSADKALTSLHDLLADAHATVRACAEGRPDEAGWHAAEQELLRTGDIAAFAAFIAAEPQRYAAAVWESRTAVARLDDARSAAKDALAKALPKLDARIADLLAQLTERAADAWMQRDEPQAARLQADATALRVEAQRLSALRYWVDGRDREHQTRGRWIPGLTTSTQCHLWATDMYLGHLRGKRVPANDWPAFLADEMAWPVGFKSWIQSLNENDMRVVHTTGAM